MPSQEPSQPDKWGPPAGWYSLPRWVRRHASRDMSRRFVQRPAPIYVPADPQPVCEPHHRKLPCKRCTP